MNLVCVVLACGGRNAPGPESCLRELLWNTLISQIPGEWSITVEPIMRKSSRKAGLVTLPNIVDGFQNFLALPYEFY